MHRLRVLSLLLLALSTGVPLCPAVAQPAASISAPIAPPPLPIYEQPPIPGQGYIWVPGYWAFGPEGYYWVPGTWVRPPAPGLLWTPAYWASTEGGYVFVPGYWAPTVGFYGGIDYGFGYSGVGYDGGYWQGDLFFYNRLVNNFGGVPIAHVFTRPVVDRLHSRVSFNGGPHGTTLSPTPAQEALNHGTRRAMTPLQLQHERAAAGNRALWNSVNHGHPAVAATARPGGFAGPEAAVMHHPPALERPGTAAAMPHVLAPAGQRPEPARQFRPEPLRGEHPGGPHFQEPAPGAGRERPEFRPMPGPHPGPQPHPRPGPPEERRPLGP